MTESKFDTILEDLLLRLKEVNSGVKDIFIVPKVNPEKLDLGQREIWLRVAQYSHYETDIGIEHDSSYDPTCEACQELYGQSLGAATRLIESYRNGKLTDPKRVVLIKYISNSKSDSVGCMYYLKDSKPVLRYAKHKTQVALQEYFDRLNSHYVTVSDVPVPDELENYILEEERQERVLFDEEM